jgi:hypothetical protein
MKMIGAGRVDDDAVRRLGRYDWREALQNPGRETLQCFGVRNRIGVLNDETRHENLGFRDRHADTKAGGVGRGVRRQHHPPAPFAANQDERRLSRRRRVASLPP